MVGECNGTVCRRYAAAWAYFSPKQVQIMWLFNTLQTEKCAEDILAVNIRMAENEIFSSIPVRKFNGATY